MGDTTRCHVTVTMASANSYSLILHTDAVNALIYDIDQLVMQTPVKDRGCSKDCIRQWALALKCTEKPDQMLEIPVCPELVGIIKRLLKSRITVNQPSFDTAKQVCQDLEIHVDETKEGMYTLRSMLYSETKLPSDKENAVRNVLRTWRGVHSNKELLSKINSQIS